VKILSGYGDNDETAETVILGGTAAWYNNYNSNFIATEMQSRFDVRGYRVH